MSDTDVEGSTGHRPVVCTAASGGGGPFPHEEAVPAGEEIQSWIVEICGKGHRSPGTPNDLWVEEYGKGKFESLGLETVLQPCPPMDTWIPGHSRLRVDNGTAPLDLEVCPMVHVRRPGVVTAPVVRYRGEDDLGRAEGSLVVLDYPLGEIANHNHLLGADYVYDPDRNIFETIHVNPMPHLSPAARTVARILQRRPAAVLAVLTDYFESPFIYGTAGRNAGLREAPGAWLSPGSGRQLDRHLQGGPAKGTLVLEVASEDAVTGHNVVGMLPGASDGVVLFDSHHDAPFMGATEDTAGIACVLAQASYWSKVPQSERPFTFVFVWSAAHLKGAVGARTFVASNRELIDRTLLAIAIETPGMEYGVKDHQLVDRHRPEPRLFQTSHVPAVQQALFEAIKGEDLRRSMIVPTDIRQGRFTGEGYHFYEAGVPVIAHLSPPAYYMDKQDTPDKTDSQGMWQMTRALIRTVWAIKDETLSSMREADARWRNRGGPPTSDRTREIILRFDKDGDGRVNAAERAGLGEYIRRTLYGE